MGDHYIWQDRRAQAVSQAADALQRAAADLSSRTQLRALDLGSGCGIVAIMLALRKPGWQITGLEIQASLCALAKRNAALCGVGVDFLEGDLRQFTGAEPFDLIVSNPPWQKPDSGRLSPSEAKNLSRFEILCDMEDVLACVGRNLSPGGDALLIYPDSRSEDLVDAARKTLLDIISLSSATGLDRYVICHIQNKGNAS